VTTLCSHFYQD